MPCASWSLFSLVALSFGEAEGRREAVGRKQNDRHMFHVQTAVTGAERERQQRCNTRVLLFGHAVYAWWSRPSFYDKAVACSLSSVVQDARLFQT